MEAVAIVGMGCVLPGALNPEALWKATLAGQDLLSDAPAGRWGLPRGHIMGEPDGKGERTWSERGGYVRGFESVYDPSGFALDAALLGQVDPLVQWLVYAGQQALAGVRLSDKVDMSRAGVVVGNLAFPSSGMSRFAERVWLGDALADAAGLPSPPPVDRFAAGLPAHLVAQALGLGGEACALDAACASSLYAIKLACDQLREGRADLMLAGAVNRADDLFIHVGFCALQAMSRTGRSRPFHSDADGLVPAEGAGIVALKRLSDAERDGDNILGLIRGVGLSNDGRGKGLLVPSPQGQVRAMREAYTQAGLSPSQISLVECHATGTRVGDRTELSSMAEIFGGRRDLPIGSLKSNLGHLITAAGVGGLIKVLGAMAHDVRPPTLHADQPTDALIDSPFRLLQSAEPWPRQGEPRRAAISAFGFGGNNAHLLVEDYEGPTRSLHALGAAPKAPPTRQVAIVGIGAMVADGQGTQDFESALFSAAPQTPRGPASEVEVSLSKLRFPPRDLAQTLAQQLMAFKAAEEALSWSSTLPRERTSVLIGMETDPNVARYGARWRMPGWADRWGVAQDAEWVDAAQGAFVPSLEAAGVLGTMPNIPANRINSQFDLSGPSMAVCAGALSGTRALQIAWRALARGEQDAALVGAVDLSHDPVHQHALKALGGDRPPGDAAVVLLLKPLEDARRDGDTVLAVLEEATAADQSALTVDDDTLTTRFGHAHAASGLLQVAAAALACARGRRPGGQPWQGERVAFVETAGLAGQQAQIALRADGAPTERRPTPDAGRHTLRFPAHMNPVALPQMPNQELPMAVQDTTPVLPIEPDQDHVQHMAPAPSLPPILSRRDTHNGAHRPQQTNAPAPSPTPSNGHFANGTAITPAAPVRRPALAASAQASHATQHNGVTPRTVAHHPSAGSSPAAAVQATPQRPQLLPPAVAHGAQGSFAPEIFARLTAQHAQMSAIHQQFMAQQQHLHQRFLALMNQPPAWPSANASHAPTTPGAIAAASITPSQSATRAPFNTGTAIQNGTPNGISNGVNGVSSRGLSNGAVNGHTNGVVNGAVNGHANGAVKRLASTQNAGATPAQTTPVTHARAPERLTKGAKTTWGSAKPAKPQKAAKAVSAKARPLGSATPTTPTAKNGIKASAQARTSSPIVEARATRGATASPAASASSKVSKASSKIEDKTLPRGRGFVLDKEGLRVHASGTISEIFGPLFKQQDGYARQTRMPEPPLLLADRMTGIDAEPGVLGRGSLWTETDIREEAWYMHEGRMPAGIMIESGQADLMLISYMGIDFLNKNERIYRLLGCELTYHGNLPKPGETLCYDIHIDGHAQQGDVRLFFFHYDCRVNGEPRLTVRGGQAGFFTEEELNNSMGILWKPETGERCDDPRLDPPRVELQRTRLERADMEAFAKGDALSCFGPGFEIAAAHTRTPRIAGGRLLFLETVTEIDHKGGPWERGYLRAIKQISPDDWFFSGHFKNDPCMPGTLMFEGCLQTMAIYMTSLGFTLNCDGWRFEPVPEETYKMRCRGQVTPESRELVYEVFIEEVIDGPEPMIFADLLCTVDGLGAFHCRRMGLRLVPDWPMEVRPELDEAPHKVTPPSEATLETASWQGFEFDYKSLLACAWGRPTTAFGDTYARFDSARKVPRLPGPPYHFMSRVTVIDGEPWAMKSGVTIEVEYDVPPEAWYFHDNGAATMPLCVLMEAALQPCGWLASLSGSTLGGDKDLYFRNLDGTGTLTAEILPESGVLKSRVTIVNISRSAGMIIESFKVECFIGETPVYNMDTVFGFFPGEALAQQAGLPITEPWRKAIEAPQDDEIVDLRRRPAKYCAGPAKMAAPSLLMLDRVVVADAKGGQEGLGFYRAEKDVDPQEWFFKAHFFQDPVQPGSLGVEAMLQALQFAMLHQDMGEGMSAPRFEALALGEALTWKYRGQVLTHNAVISTTLEIVEVRREEGAVVAIAQASLWVDGKRIYEARRLGMRLVDAALPPAVRRVTLDPAAEPWLGDHQPTWTVPALPMMSMVEQLAAAVTREGRVVTALRDVRVARWLPLPEATTLEIHRQGVVGEVQVRIEADDELVLQGRAAVDTKYTAGPAPWSALDAPVQPDPYASGALFHGPAFQAMTQWRLGDSGSSAWLDAAPGSIPPGVLNQRLLDAALHAIPSDSLHRWSDEIPADVVGYPVLITEATFHCRTPLSGPIRCEVRFDGFHAGQKRMPAFRIQLIEDQRVWATMRLVEAVFPKGPIGTADPEARRAFLRDREAVPGVALSSTTDEGATRLLREDVAASDWLPGTIKAIYGTEDAALIAAHEHLSRQTGLHPGALPQGLPINTIALDIQQDEASVTVRGAGEETLDLGIVEDYWASWFDGLRDWAVADLYLGLVKRFVRRVMIADPGALEAVKGRGALFISNHQVAVESLLFGVIASALIETPTMTLAKIEHKETWLGRLIAHCAAYPDTRDPALIAFFDRQDKASLPGILAELAAQMMGGDKALMVHVEGTRALSARHPVKIMSSIFIDMAQNLNVPLIPVRFVGALPVEPVAQRLEFPVGMGRQDIWIGRPIQPETLARMPLGERKAHVLAALNQLGPALEGETPWPGDERFQARVSEIATANDIEEPDAVLRCVLEDVPAPSADTRFLLGHEGAEAPEKNSRRQWLRALQERLKLV